MKVLIEKILRFHPQLAGQIKGVSDDEIIQLEKISGYTLPDEYKDFLRNMGHHAGRIKIVIKNSVAEADQSSYIRETPIDVRYDSVIKYYRKMKTMSEKKRLRLKRNLEKAVDRSLDQLFLIGINPIGNDAGNLYIDLSSKALRVVELTETFGETEHSPSLMEFLFKASFRRETVLRLQELNY
ncbi:MAG: hypothetical protein JW827_04095 [Spirochaetes bacterium]|nr:hypothetical protein [Spirochaetota bacterium]